jgi:putative ABC transport system substrate-binding protein
MRRRDFITLLGGAAAAWPLAARAQERLPTPTIGWLDQIDPHLGPTEVLAGFNQGLAEQGYVVGRNVNLEFRSAEGDADRMRMLAADLVRRQVAMIVAKTGTAAHAAKAATASIPIVFRTGTDPVASGLVASFNRPGGNLTGVSFFAGRLGSKRLSLLHDLVPDAALIGMLADPSASTNDAQIGEAQDAAHSLGFHLFVVQAATEPAIDTAFAAFIERRVQGLLVAASAFLSFDRIDRIVALAARHAIPAIYAIPDFASAGGLISYGASYADSYRQLGVYAGRILKGAKPADLPVEQSTKFELVINLKTAKALGLTVPPSLLAVADELIE